MTIFQIDSFFQKFSPALHVIIEPHPDVLQHIRETQWYDKPGVKILEGKWQQLVGSDEMKNFGGFDIVYTDTFSEDYDGADNGSCTRVITDNVP